MPEFKTEVDVAKWNLAHPKILSPVESGQVTTDADGFAHVTFAAAFDNTDYAILLSVIGSAWPCVASYAEPTVSGFDVYTRDTRNGGSYAGIEVSWFARKVQ